MNDDQYVYLWELLASELEKSYVRDLAGPFPIRSRREYVAWLRMENRNQSAALIEGGFSPVPDAMNTKSAYEEYHTDR